MKKKLKQVGICLLLVCLVWGGTVIMDRQRLDRELIRLHIVANSDSKADQSLKLQVRDAVLESLRSNMQELKDVDTAKAYLGENLPKLKAVAENVIKQSGLSFPVNVSLQEENFPVRVYDTFRLPSGVYQALRITIGVGAGHNWWCVVFPQLCAPATVEGFVETAACSDFSDGLTAALAGEQGYELRFFLLDAFGKVESLLHR